LEPLSNPAAFRVKAKAAGNRRQHSEVVSVSATFRAVEPDRVLFLPIGPTSAASAGVRLLAGHVPVVGGLSFTHQLISGDTRLSGYGRFGVSHPRLALSDEKASDVEVLVSGAKGPLKRLLNGNKTTIGAVGLLLTTFTWRQIELLSYDRRSQAGFGLISRV
jgi:hypothetical protein